MSTISEDSRRKIKKQKSDRSNGRAIAHESRSKYERNRAVQPATD